MYFKGKFVPFEIMFKCWFSIKNLTSTFIIHLPFSQVKRRSLFFEVLLNYDYLALKLLFLHIVHLYLHLSSSKYKKNAKIHSFKFGFKCNLKDFLFRAQWKKRCISICTWFCYVIKQYCVFSFSMNSCMVCVNQFWCCFIIIYAIG